MSSQKRLAATIFLCLQILFLSVAGAGISTSDDLHVATSHDLAVDHHHHDAFSLHFDHEDGNKPHVHATDSLQSIALAPLTLALIHFTKAEVKSRLSVDPPADIFPDGLLRPPQLIL
jgi:hypothetical protein